MRPNYAIPYIHRTYPQIAAVSLRADANHQRQIHSTCRTCLQAQALFLIFQPNRTQILLPYLQIAVVRLRVSSIYMRPNYAIPYIHRTYPQIAAVSLRVYANHKRQIRPTCRTCLQIAAVRLRVSSISMRPNYAIPYIHRTCLQIVAVLLRDSSNHQRQIRPTCRTCLQVQALFLIFQPNRARILSPFLPVADVFVRDCSNKIWEIYATRHIYRICLRIVAVPLRVRANHQCQIHSIRHIHRTYPQIADVHIRVSPNPLHQTHPTCRTYPQIRDLCLIFQTNRAQTLLPYPQIAVVFLIVSSSSMR